MPEQYRTRMRSSRFLSYLVAQTFGTLNDNAYKMTLLLFGLEQIKDPATQVAFSSLLTALFPLPWLPLSPWAGYMADRYRKDRVLLATKIPEFVFLALGAYGFYVQSLPLLLAVFVLMAAQAASFSPAKYGILPEVLGPQDLAEANGLVSMTTNVAILIGTVIGVEVFGLFSPTLVWAGTVYAALALAGIAATLYLPLAPPGHRNAAPPVNLLRQFRQDRVAVKQVPTLLATTWGLAYYSFLGSLLLGVLPIYGTTTLGLSTHIAGRLVLPLVIGLSVGSVLAGRLSRGRVELGLTPLGALIMGIFSIDLLLHGTTSQTQVIGLPLIPVVDFGFIGIGAALFNVPLNAQLQHRSPDAQKGQLIGYSNVMCTLAIMSAAACGYLLTLVQNFDVRYLFVALSAVTIGGTLHIVWLLPDFVVRMGVYLGTSVLYRLHILGANHIPRTGAVLVAGQGSWLDALLATAASGRMVRFLVPRALYEARPFHVLLRWLHVIPLDSADAALARARAEVEAGHTVCLFMEGGLARTGPALGLGRALEHILGGLDAPIIPLGLEGLADRPLRFEDGRVRVKWPRGLRQSVRVLFGAPLKATASELEVRRALQELAADAQQQRDSRAPAAQSSQEQAPAATTAAPSRQRSRRARTP